MGAQTYRVPVANLDTLTERLARLNRRTKRLGLAAITMTRVGTESRERTKRNGYGEVVRLPDLVLAVVEVSGQRPVIAGWQFVATLQHEDAGTILRTVPAAGMADGDLDRYRDAAPDCDHCGLRRRRKDTYVVRNTETGDLRQVGRNCLADFLGHEDPHAYAALAELTAAAHELFVLGGEDGFGGSRGRDAWTAVDFLAVVAAIVREYGWTSRGKARDMHMPPGSATADMALSWLAYVAAGSARKPFKFEHEPGEVDQHRAQVILDKTDAAIETKDAAGRINDYEHNLRVSLASGYVVPRSAGIAASAVAYVMRLEQTEAESKAAAVNARHVGTVGERVDYVVTVLAARPFEGAYGVTTAINMALEDGARLTWFASGDRSGDAEVGTQVWLTATIKAHETDKRLGTPVTMVTRGELGDWEEFAAQTANPCNCGAEAGQWCRAKSGKRVANTHKRRRGQIPE